MAKIHFGFMPAVAESAVPVAVADGADVDPWFDTLGRMVLKGLNLPLEAFDVNEVADATTQVFNNVWAQLTAAGVTSSVSADVYHNHTFQIVVAAIDVSVTVRAEGSLDNTNFYNLDDTGSDTTYLANGVYLMHKPDYKTNYIRFRFVSEVGGANVTLDVTYMAGN